MRPSPRSGARALRPRRHPKTAALAAVFGVVLATPQLTAAHAAPQAPQLPASLQSSAPGAVPTGKAPDPTVGPVTTDRITLITGDVAVVNRDAGGRTSVTLTPAPGRENITYSTVQEKNGDVSVLPSDVSALITADLVDPQLFNVTRLIDYGYTDAARTELPVLTRRQDKTKAAVPRGVKKNRSFDIIGVDAADVPKDKAADVWKELTGDPKDAAKRGNRKALGAGTRKISLDGKVRIAQGLDESTAQIDAPQMWQSGYTGTGVNVAVLDTGIDAGHPDLQGKVVASKDFTGNPQGVADGHGHGTHVASIIAGTGAASGGRYKGVAPDAKLIVGKVLGNDGRGQWSAVMDGVKWAVDEAGAKIVSMSLGGVDTPGVDDLEALVNGYSFYRGTLFVVAAGNNGANGPLGMRTVTTPGSALLALTVGAVDGAGNIASFSGRGPVADSRAPKPDVTAPGVNIVAARAAGTAMGSAVDANYTSASGTSMATPHTAGAAALLLQAHPTWMGIDVRSALIASGRANPSLKLTDQGMGLVSAAGANAQKLGAMWETVSQLAYPHPQGQTDTQYVQVKNFTGQATTVNAQLQAFGLDGSPAPPGALALGSTQLTIPAGQLVQLPVVARGDVPIGAYYAYVTLASADGTYTTRFRVGSAVKPQEQSVTLSAPGTGTLVGANAILFDQAGVKPRLDLAWSDTGWSGVVEVGNYNLWAAITYVYLGVYKTTMINVPVTVAPGQDFTGSWNLGSAVMLDYRVDRGDSQPVTASAFVSYSSNSEPGYAASTWAPAYAYNSLGPWSVYVLPVQMPGLQFTGQRALRQNVTGAPAFTANVVYRDDNGISATQTRTAQLSGMAHYRTSYKGQGVAAKGSISHDYFDPRTSLQAATSQTMTDFPATIDEYFTAVPGGFWQHSASVWSTTKGSQDVWHPVEEISTPGDKGASVFFQNVGPSLPRPLVRRTGNSMTFYGQAQMFADRVQGSGIDFQAPPLVTLDVDGVRVSTVQTDYVMGSPNLGWYVDGLPAGNAEYTLTVSATRDHDYAATATQVKAQWKFHSASTGPGTTYPDLGAVFFYLTDTTDSLGRVPANSQPWVIVGRGTPPGTPGTYEAPQSLVVEASTNDGATWTVLPVTPSMFGPAVQLPVLAAGSYVSLRATWTRPNGDVTMTSVTRQFGVAA